MNNEEKRQVAKALLKAAEAIEAAPPKTLLMSDDGLSMIDVAESAIRASIDSLGVAMMKVTRTPASSTADKLAKETVVKHLGEFRKALYRKEHIDLKVGRITLE